MNIFVCACVYVFMYSYICVCVRERGKEDWYLAPTQCVFVFMRNTDRQRQSEKEGSEKLVFYSLPATKVYIRCHMQRKKNMPEKRYEPKITDPHCSGEKYLTVALLNPAESEREREIFASSAEIQTFHGNTFQSIM